MTRVGTYLPRHVDGLISELLTSLPALMLIGPRAVGKTTTAARYARTVVRLDDPREATAIQADPDAALRGLAEPVLLDEWQMVPEVLGAVKRSVDADARAGRYIITGSARGRLDTPTWPGTGRIVLVPMFGLTMRERMGSVDGDSLLDRLASGEDIEVDANAPDLRDYVRFALESGFPEAALRLSDTARERWLRSYIHQLTTRDAEHLDGGRDPARLARFIEALALNSAGTAEAKTVYEAAGISKMTAEAYTRLLTNLFVIDAIPAWRSNRLKRLAVTAKRHMVEPALMAAALGIGEEGILRDGDLLGRLLDTFVTSQVRAELETSRTKPRIFHLRQEQGRHEIDLVVELDGRQIICIEVKATSAPTVADARHLTWMRDALEGRFLCGVVLHTGPRVYRLDEGIIAVPICALWSQ